MTPTAIFVKRGDQLPVLEAQLTYDDGSIIDLTGSGVTFQYRKLTWPLNKAVARTCDVFDPEDGMVRYSWLTSDITEAGTYEADFEIIYNDGKHLSVPTQNHVRLIVYDDLGDLTPPVVTDEEDTADEGAKYLYAKNYPGLFGGQQILNAMNALPPTGGTVDTRGLGDQVWNFSYAAVTKPVLLLLWSGTIKVITDVVCPASLHIEAHDAIFDIQNGITLSLSSFSGNLAKHFQYTGTGKMVFSASTGLRTLYAEWWGAVADGLTNSLDGLYNASKAMPNNSKLQLQPGKYVCGSTAEKPAMWPDANNIEICGAGGTGTDATILEYQSSYHNSPTKGSCIFYGDYLNAWASIRDGICLRDFSMFDTNTGSAFDWLGVNPSGFSGVFVNRVKIQGVHFKDIKGNSAVGLLGRNVTNTDNGERLEITDCFFEGTAAGGWIEFASINPGGWHHGYMMRNKFMGARQAYVSFNDGQTQSTPEGIFIAHNHINMLNFGNNGVEGIRCGAGRGIHIEHNTILNIPQEGRGISIGQETADYASTAVEDLYITHNVIRGSGANSTVGVYISNISTDNLHLENNDIAGVIIPFTCGIRSDASAYGPGLRTASFSHNLIDGGGNNITVFDFDQIEDATAVLSAGTIINIHDNTLKNLGFDAIIVNFHSRTILRNERVRVHDNINDTTWWPRNILLGMPWLATFPAAIPPGGMGFVDVSYEGAKFGDDVTVLGLNGGVGIWHVIPAGVQIWGYVIADDMVRFVAVNHSSGFWQDTVLFLGERRR